MGIGMKSLKWEGIGTKNLFPHTSSVDACTVLEIRVQTETQRDTLIATLSLPYKGRSGVF